MSEMATVHVPLGARAYDVRIGSGLLARAGTEIAPLLGRSRVFVVTEDRVAALHLEALRAGLGAEGITMEALILPPGESTKGWPEFTRTVEWLLEQRVERKDMVVAFGGGVIGDLAGFAAAVLRRGVRFVQIPTSLLAQVDSSVGGKTGINSVHGKNLIGAFHQPRLVLIDPSTLNTLPEREFRAGMAEVIKYGILGDTALFEELEACPDPSTPAGLGSERLSSILQRSAAAKARVVAADEKEGGLRAILNYGHTFGHVVETLCGYGTWLHGEAVAIGMVAVGELGVLRGSWSREDAERQRRLIDSAGLPTAWPDLAADAVLDSLQGDKKVRDGRLRFVMPTSIGTVEIRDDVSRDEILSCLERLKG